MAINSPLISTHRDIEPLDLIIAVQLCSESTLGKMSWKDHLYLAKLKRNKQFFQDSIRAFSAYSYIAHHPKFWEKTDKTSGSSDSGIGWPLMVVANLIANGISEERAWDMPECQAIWLSTAFIKLKGGDIHVLTTEEEEYMENERQKVAEKS